MVQIQGGGGPQTLSTCQIISICNDYRIADNFRIGVKLSRWGKSSLGGVKINHLGTCKRDSKMCWVRLLTSTIQIFLLVYLDFVIRDPEKGSRNVA